MATNLTTISLTTTTQPWGDESTVACDGCAYYRHHASQRVAEHDQLTHEC